MSAHILIVDDDQTSCQLLVKVLTASGISADWTTDSIASYTMFLQRPYDLVILDVRMPGILGTELAEGIKQEKPDIKILLISAFADKALRKTADRLGAALLSKPFTPARLLEAIATLLSRST
jgi:two-component system, sensor histidine kinase